MSEKPYFIQTLRIGPLQVNTYIVAYQGQALVVDPGGEAERILAVLRNNNLKLTHILLTHGHFDHIGAVNRLKRETDARVYIHRLDAPALEDPAWNLSDQFKPNLIICSCDVELEEGDTVDFGEGLRVIHTPGHTLGGCCYEMGDIVFTGDTILDYSIGRTDFPGGSYDDLMNSINNKLFKLEGDRIFYPGHGDMTRLSDEMEFNAFVGKNPAYY